MPHEKTIEINIFHTLQRAEEGFAVSISTLKVVLSILIYLIVVLVKQGDSMEVSKTLSGLPKVATWERANLKKSGYLPLEQVIMALLMASLLFFNLSKLKKELYYKIKLIFLIK